MKRKVLFTTALFLSFAVFQIAAQEQGSGYEQPLNKKNWFFSIGPTLNILNAEMDNELAFKDRVDWGGSFSVGKWFTPYFGTRMQFQYGSLTGFNYGYESGQTSRGLYITPDRLKRVDNIDKNVNLFNHNGLDGFYQEFNYFSAGFDLMANMTNLFYGTERVYPFEVIPFAGVGVVSARESATNPTTYGYDFRGGLRLNYNFSADFAIYSEFQGSLLHNEFDGYVGDQAMDTKFHAGLGIQLTVNRFVGQKTSSLTQGEIEHMNGKLNQLQNQLNGQDGRIDRIEDDVNTLKNRPYAEPSGATIVKESINNRALPTYVRFSIASAVIEQTETFKLADVVDLMNRKPSAKLLLVGYADRRTGNADLNLRLSERRVTTVANYLQSKGIAPNRLILNWKGDMEQPYSVNDWNRVVVITER